MLFQSGDTMDAIELLERDHEAVEDLFEQFEDAKESGDDEKMAALAASICSALTVHAQIEEELFYPEVKKLGEATELVDEAKVEHETVKDLVSEIEAMRPG